MVSLTLQNQKKIQELLLGNKRNGFITNYLGIHSCSAVFVKDFASQKKEIIYYKHADVWS